MMEQLNYYHYLSNDHCSVYCAGFMSCEKAKVYKDAKRIQKVDGEDWYYSDACFIEVIQALEKSLKWTYVGEPQVVILQSSNSKKSQLDFRNNVSLDLAQGICKGYIESIPR